MALTARDLIRRLASDASLQYGELARRVNAEMQKGTGLQEAVGALARESGLDPSQYRLDAKAIADEVRSILKMDYSQTLMISAVLGQMVESKGRESLPVPAFFAFLELLSGVADAPRRKTAEPEPEVDENTTRIVELTTTLVSLVCEWSTEGITGVASDCPPSLRDLARAVFRRTRMYQQGIWTCLSCGRMVHVKETRALLCLDCDAKMYGDLGTSSQESDKPRDRVGYGRSIRDDLEE